MKIISNIFSTSLQNKKPNFFGLFLAVFFVFNILIAQPYVMAEPMSKDEQKALNGWVNWVAGGASCDLSGGSDSATTGNGKTVVIDPGHAGANTQEIDPASGIVTVENGGASGERTNMWDTAQIIKSTLESKGYKVVLTKNGVDDTAGFLTKVKRANDAGAVLAVSLHYTLGDFTASNDHWGVTPQEVGRFRENKTNGKRKTFDDASLASKSQEYAKVIAQARNDGGINTKVVPLDQSFRKDRPDVAAWGDISMVQLFGKLPWVYNEVGYNGFNKQKYADTISAGIEKILSDPSATSTAPSAQSGSCQCPSGGGVSLSGSNNAEKIFNFFVSKGLKAFQAAGIVGNIMHESNAEPQRLQGTPAGTVTPANNVSGNIGWGIVQWTPASKFIDPTKSAGKDPNDIGVQLEFLFAQLQGQGPSPEKQAGDDVKSTTNIEDAVRAFQGDSKIGGKYPGYERPQSESDSLADRIASAKSTLRLYGGGSVTTTEVSGGGTCVSGSFGDFDSTLKAYAWPDYHPAPYTTRKPAYADAVTKADKDGIYRGGTVNGVDGIDCGGFVTLLMINSGFEPKYNYSGKLSAGAGATTVQKPWLDANWKLIHPTTTNDLHKGDVAISSTHTFVYVGDVAGFNSKFASASYSTEGNGRAPMAGAETTVDTSFNWYTKK